MQSFADVICESPRMNHSYLVLSKDLTSPVPLPRRTSALYTNIQMALPHPPRALFFDVFGTCVDWRKTVTHALFDQAHASLNSATASLATSLRLRATDMTLEHWGTFAQQWRDTYKVFTRTIASDPNTTWKSVDQHHHDALKSLLVEWQLDGLWTEEEVLALSLIWHRLNPWADTAAGINALNNLFYTVTLSNGNITLLNDLKEHGSIPFTHIFSAEMFKSYKPSPKVYLGAVERLGLEPRDCAMVAAHLNDLKAAKSNGLQTIYVERSREEDWPREEVQAAREEGFVDLWVTLDQQGFLAVAKHLGIDVDSSGGNLQRSLSR